MRDPPREEKLDSEGGAILLVGHLSVLVSAPEHRNFPI